MIIFQRYIFPKTVKISIEFKPEYTIEKYNCSTIKKINSFAQASDDFLNRDYLN